MSDLTNKTGTSMSNKEELYRKIALNMINKYIGQTHKVWYEYGCSDRYKNRFYEHISHYCDLLDAADRKEEFKKQIDDSWIYEEEEWIE